MSERMKLTDPDENQGSGTKIGKGAYINNFVIKKIEDKSNYPGSDKPLNFFKSGGKAELYLILYMEDVDNQFEKQLHLFGKFKRDKKNEELIIGWDNWMNGVQRLLYKVLGDQSEIDTADYSIPEDVLKKLVGKEIRVISYITDKQYEANDGSMKYQWDQFPKVFDGSATDEEVQEEWNNNIQWYLDNGKYVPSIVDQQETEFNHGANANNSETQNESEQTNYDDDLDPETII